MYIKSWILPCMTLNLLLLFKLNNHLSCYVVDYMLQGIFSSLILTIVFSLTFFFFFFFFLCVTSILKSKKRSLIKL
jgi:hypothetical protein